MEDRYIEARGAIIAIGELTIPKAIEVALAVKTLSDLTFIEARMIDNGLVVETVVFDAVVERCQHPVHDIRRTERLAVEFEAGDEHLPEVLALREDFPSLPHQNLRPQEKPKSLCLFEERYEEIKLRWNPLLFLQRIQDWLKLSARGELHQQDQPLEPLLSGSYGTLIYPHRLFISEGNAPDTMLNIQPIELSSNWFTLRASLLSKGDTSEKDVKYLAIAVRGKPQEHGIISREPSNLLELHSFLEEAEIDLLQSLRKHINECFLDGQQYANANLIIIACLPKTRDKNGEIESSDVLAFLIPNTLKEISVEIGACEIRGNYVCPILFNAYNVEKKGDKLGVMSFNTVSSLARELANCLNLIDGKLDINIVVVGVGALGSQIVMNMIKMGVGKWTIVDEDCLLPHNLSKHALSGFAIGHSKAATIAILANTILDEEDIAKAIVADALKPGENLGKLNKSYADADLIVDASTSIPVARHIACDIESDARRVSVFLNLSGDSLVVLAEDKDREYTLDCLEMQYYRALINEPELAGHMEIESEGIRYGRSCRDVSNRIPQYLVAMHSAICSKALVDLLADETAKIDIWKTKRADLTTRHFSIPVFPISSFKIGEWTLCIDTFIYDKILSAREAKLPNETGGILIGSADRQRKIIYIFETILSPSDSIEWPTVYIRGHKSLQRKVEEIRNKTQDFLFYVGEWHSHPNGCSTWPSSDDFKAFIWLSEEMAVEGLPGVMMIAGDGQSSWYVDNMEKPKD